MGIWSVGSRHETWRNHGKSQPSQETGLCWCSLAISRSCLSSIEWFRVTLRRTCTGRKSISVLGNIMHRWIYCIYVYNCVNIYIYIHILCMYVYTYIYIYIYISIYLIYLSIYLSIDLSIYRSIYLSIYIYRAIWDDHGIALLLNVSTEDSLAIASQATNSSKRPVFWTTLCPGARPRSSGGCRWATTPRRHLGMAAWDLCKAMEACMGFLHQERMVTSWGWTKKNCGFLGFN